MDIITTGLLWTSWAWIAFELIARFAFASENYIDEWLLGGDDENDEEGDNVGTLLIISGLFGFVIAALIAVYATFLGDKGEILLIGKGLASQATFNGMLELLWVAPYLYAVKRSGALEAAPLFQAVPVIALILGMIAYLVGWEKFAEIPPALHLVAGAIIIAGGFMLNLAEIEGKWKLDKGTIVLMIMSSTVIAVMSFIFKDVAEESNFIGTAFWTGIGMGIGGLTTMVIIKPYRQQFLSFCKDINGTKLSVQLFSETVDMVASMLSYLAILVGPSVVIVSALGGAYQPIFILLIGWWQAKRGSVKHEDSLKGSKFTQKTVAISLIAAGTVLIIL